MIKWTNCTDNGAREMIFDSVDGNKIAGNDVFSVIVRAAYRKWAAFVIAYDILPLPITCHLVKALYRKWTAFVIAYHILQLTICLGSFEPLQASLIVLCKYHGFRG